MTFKDKTKMICVTHGLQQVTVRTSAFPEADKTIYRLFFFRLFVQEQFKLFKLKCRREGFGSAAAVLVEVSAFCLALSSSSS